jgi:SAM-dependent methyltransferase
MFAKKVRKLRRHEVAATGYETRITQQIAQYATEEIHDVPPIYDYWADTHIRPRLNSVLGVDTVLEFYVEHIRERAEKTCPAVVRILSLGAGDAELEVRIAQELLSRGPRTFHLECIELSPILVDKAKQRIQDAKVEAHVGMVQTDLNSWSQGRLAAGTYNAVIANQVLHHVVELEALFDNVALAIGNSGVFLTADMIGRNGHKRWPEAMTLVNALWDTLPEKLKYNHVFCQSDQVFNDWDCCAEGFEGIRAQDILPLLVQRFQFEKFLGFGNLPDVFCDRFYGPNFDPAIPAHARFIDSVEQVNSLLLELGVLKPTKMLAVISNNRASHTRFWKNLSPQFCIRDPASSDFSASRQKSTALSAALPPERFCFCKGGSGEHCLRNGWSGREEWGTWMVGDEAVLELAIPIQAKDRAQLTLAIRATAFIPQRLRSRSFSFSVDGATIDTVAFIRSEKMPKTFPLELNMPASDPFQLRIIAHEQASPAEEGSVDRRLLGLALIEIAVY